MRAELDRRVEQAHAALQAGEADTAIGLARGALQMAPAHDPALEVGWLACMRAQRWDWALTLGQRWCEAHPNELAAWQARLLPQLLLHRAQACAAALQEAHAALGPHPLLTTIQALLFAMTGDDQRSADAAAQLPSADLQSSAVALLGPSVSTLLTVGWQPALLRAYLLYEQQLACVWAGREALVQTLPSLLRLPHIPWQPLRVVAMTFNRDEGTQVALVDRMADGWPQAGSVRAAPAGARLRVAYLSPCLGAHAVVVMMGRLPREQDRSRFEVYAYGFAPGREVSVGELLVQGCDTLRGLPPDAEQAAAIIRADKIDVLIVMPDWEMDWLARVCRASGAPVVINYLSICGSTGGLAHYRIVDDSYVASEPPPREAVIRQRGSCFVYSAHTEHVTTRRAHGLPQDAVVVAAFHAGSKIGPELAEVWVRLLKEVPAAVLWLHQTHPLQAVQLQAWFADRGIGAERLVFAATAPHAEHLARSALADLYLDAWDYNGHTSILDALYAGVPVVTREGSCIVQRIGATLLCEHGAHAWVAHSEAEYEALALRLMRSAPERLAYRRQLERDRASFMPFQLATQARRLDAAIEAAHARYRQGLPPADIVID